MRGMMGWAVLGCAFIFPAFAGQPDQEVLKELAPTGTLRIGVAYAPSLTPVFVLKNAHGDVQGVPSDIGLALANTLGVPAQVVALATTGELTDRVEAGTLDVAFTPINAERRARVDFSPAYFTIESTYLATAGSGIKAIADADRPEVTVVGIDGSTTMRAAMHASPRAKFVTAKSVDEAIGLLKTGRAQAFALTHDSLPAVQQQLPGSRILDGAFQVTGVGMSVRKDHPAALAYATAFMNKAKADGLVRRAFDAAGLHDRVVASGDHP